ncbi:CDP-diacylglycerol--glycerol-3-phosphate 3-phosphatidyltransferase [Longibacter salinarum]|uniref:CDP-diacylglycerol--glycerol-3-phosphate 3-phosphatidyltransferase n=1 Tax=Longibacter salinarum TaxID=1850348 RepID=A0A2A8D215_9BACT|nr:CDP-diacylglycerol--glycerol-3-phosphate 3-phosphatidyltransferase [Longibacter salinarum]PEN14924.1 CDP-diacylglycerol--glycerol-3-phosphate 3-phosphatidyltransferase [Longibacter salinarum]
MSRHTALHHIPNLLTVARILLTPLVLVLLTVASFAGQAAALLCFMAAGISDYYDGVLARRMKARSRLGQFLDPLADKILVLGTFIMLLFVEPGAVTWWGVALIALRDIVVTAVRSYAESQGRTLKTFRVAKWKTLLQLFFLWAIMLLRTLEYTGAGPTVDWILRESGMALLAFYAVVAFTLFTGALYIFQPQDDSV